MGCYYCGNSGRTYSLPQFKAILSSLRTERTLREQAERDVAELQSKNEGFALHCQESNDRIVTLENERNSTREESLVLALLASDKPQFSNPIVVAKAKDLARRIVNEHATT